MTNNNINNTRRADNTAALPRPRIHNPEPSAVDKVVGAVGNAALGIEEARELMRSVAEPDVRVRTVAARERRPLPIVAIVLTIVCALAAMLMIINLVSLNEVNMELSKTDKAIVAAESEQKMLAFEVDRKNNLVEIADYARNQLGMVDASQIRTVYINEGKTDKVETYDVPDTDRSIFGDLLSAIGDNFKAYWNILSRK